MTVQELENIARVCHAANREIQKINGDPVNPHWESLPAELKDSTMSGVVNALNGADARDLHASWMMERALKGWQYGPVKDEAAKTHPQMVPYADLPANQKVKDAVFGGIVEAMGGYIEPYGGQDGGEAAHDRGQ